MASSLPKEMRAVQCTGPRQLTMATVPVPPPGAKEVLIRVAASAVNPVDYKVYDGGLALAQPYPFIPGCDLAGTVVAVGSDVTDFKVGDEVVGMTGSLGQGPRGTLAEYAIGWEDMLAKKPASLSMRQAAAIPLVLMTAWEGMMDRIRVKSTDHVLVFGGSGAIGQICLQLAKVAGAARVYGVASAGKRDLVEQYGATFIDYKLGDDEIRRVVKEQTPNGRGCDLIYESVGGRMLDLALELLAPHGYIATINGFEAHELAPAALKGAMISFPLTCLPFMHPEPQTARYMGGLLRESLPLVADGKVEILVDEVNKLPFTADGVVQAYEVQRTCTNRGKIVIDIV